jgi:hypothetical protein
MFLQNVGGTFPWPHLVVSSASPTPTTVRSKQELSSLPPAQKDSPDGNMAAVVLTAGPGEMSLRASCSALGFQLSTCRTHEKIAFPWHPGIGAGKACCFPNKAFGCCCKIPPELLPSGAIRLGP